MQPQPASFGVWDVFDASNANFAVGRPTVGELILVGETYGQQQQSSNQPSHVPTLCVFTKPEYDHIHVMQPSDILVTAFQSQSEGCYQKFNYYSANKTYDIPFEWNTTAAGALPLSNERVSGSEQSVTISSYRESAGFRTRSTSTHSPHSSVNGCCHSRCTICLYKEKESPKTRRGSPLTIVSLSFCVFHSSAIHHLSSTTARDLVIVSQSHVSPG